MSLEKTIVVLNRSKRAFTTTKGLLPINGTIELLEKEAKSLIDGYVGELIDASKFIPSTSKVEELKKENETLKKENEELKKQVAELQTTKKKKEDK